MPEKFPIGFIGLKVRVYTEVEPMLKKYGSLTLDEFEYVGGRALHMELNGRTHFVIYLGVLDATTIIHECSHITTYVMKHYDIDDDEFRAYVCSFMANRIIKSML